MSTALELALRPSTSLCESCQAFDLIEYFYCTSETKDPFASSYDIDLAKLLENQHSCTLCAFYMCALALDPRFSLIQPGAPDIVTGKISVYRHQIGTVKVSVSSTSDQAGWPNKMRGWQQKGDTFERAVWSMTLGPDLVDETGRRATPPKIIPHISIVPMCTGEEPIYDRFLHHTTRNRNRIDLDLVRGWMMSCKLYHQATCSSSPWHDIGSAHLRMVDVQEGCIVQIKHQVEYFALSYCWGSPRKNRPQLQLNSQTREYLERQGAISEILSMVPQTIQDAIQLTRDLGCRYLWVDALCIAQDDRAHKMSQIAQMDKVYTHAAVTVVGASGRDAWDGLPGVRDGTRFTRSLRQAIGDVTLLAIWPKRYFPSDQPANWAWPTRCWAFQEQICSKRLLLFTNEEVVWDCGNELLTEGANPRTASDLSHVSVDVGKDRRFGMKPSAALSPLQLYNFYMAGISSRRLGYEEDRLNSATGLLNTLRAFFPSGYIWGLPIDVLDCAMLFHCGVWDEAPFKPRSMFPSWCWARHECHARSSIAGPYWAGFESAFKVEQSSFKAEKDASWIRKEIAFHCISEDGLTWSDLQSKQITEDGSVFYRTSLEQWQINKPELLLVEAKLRLDEIGIPQNHALAGFIQVVDLDVAHSMHDRIDLVAGEYSKSYGYAVRTPLGRYVCGLQLTEDYRKTQPDKLTFILVAQQRRWNNLLGPIFELIHVKQRSGLTFRVQIGCESMLTLDIWGQLTPRWEFVILV